MRVGFKVGWLRDIDAFGWVFFLVEIKLVSSFRKVLYYLVRVGCYEKDVIVFDD